MPKLVVETWQEAQARKLAERAALEAERGTLGKQLHTTSTRVAEINQAIKRALRQRQDVGGLRAELAPLEMERDDLIAQLAGVDADIALIVSDAEDGLSALIVKHRSDLQQDARAASAAEAEITGSFIDMWGQLKAARATSVRTWRLAFGIGPEDAGYRAEDFSSVLTVGGRPMARVDSRLPGGSPADVVALSLGDPAYGGGRAAPIGEQWVEPYGVLDKILTQLAGRSCLPAVVATHPDQGKVGVYRNAVTGDRVPFDEDRLRRRWHEVAAGDDGFVQLIWESELTAGDRRALEINREEDRRWRAGEPAPKMTPISMPDPMRVTGDHLAPDAPGDGPAPVGDTPGPAMPEHEVILSRGSGSLSAKQRPGYPRFEDV